MIKNGGFIFSEMAHSNLYGSGINNSPGIEIISDKELQCRIVAETNILFIEINVSRFN